MKGGIIILYNIMERFVDEELQVLIEEGSYTGCQCSQCLSDIKAFALNRLPARYVVTQKGEAISKVEASIPQNRGDMIAVIVEACNIVEKNPRHEKRECKQIV